MPIPSRVPFFRSVNLRTLLLLAALPSLASAQDTTLPAKIDFNRDVRPILSDNCFKCHGFDPKTREADRRLDTRAGALASLEGITAIVPGKLTESDVHVRIHSSAKDEIMPPPESGKKLSARERAILDRWIEQGAEYQGHWAYEPLQKVPVPAVVKPGFSRNPIDSFLLARQQALGLPHAPAAEPSTLLRRLHFDLTGLPPKPEALAALPEAGKPTQAAAPNGASYEALVDQLLASPAYSERMAVFWLDLVRYADSIGYHSDNARNVSPYRDYVIRAFHENKRFDEFTREQLAGDLLPNATRSQKVASGYNRLVLTTEEGGAQPKEYEQRTVADRVRSIGTTWLGQTIACAQCHDHKFDPITTRDFYRLGAFFADIKEESIGRREDGLRVGTEAQEAKLQELTAKQDALQAKLDGPSPELDAAQAVWEARTLKRLNTPQTWTPLIATKLQSDKEAGLTVEADGLIRSARAGKDADVYRITVPWPAEAITGFRLEALASSRLPKKGPGHAESGNFVLTEFSVAAPGKDALPFTKATATFEQADYPAAEAVDGKIVGGDNGWGITGGVGVDQALYAQLAEPLVRSAGAEPLTFTLRFDYGNQHMLGKFRLAYTTSAGPIEPPQSSAPPEIATLLKTDPAQRDDAARTKLRNHFRGQAPELATLRTELADAKKQREDFDKTIDRSLVSESMEKPRTVRVLPRGNWQDETGEIVEPGVLDFLPQPKVEGRRLTRLDLADWLVARDNPLTARVFVNRLWKLFFGTGLSKVLDDVGAQGELPAHGALLDWLAGQFVESGWDVKHVVRLIVTSGAYRQSSFAPPELQQRDPENREVARQSRYRLDAEFVRDNALAISGLLVDRVGGRSVHPYQPVGYWENLNFPTREWTPSKDDNQWRRGLYTWWQRSYLHPSLMAFDAPSREECTAERVRSNIPQQALALLNDPTYVEAARAFAVRIVREGGGDIATRLGWAYRQALAREPRADELATLTALFDQHRALFTADRTAAEALLKTGLAPVPKDFEAGELAAWTSVARAILNLHETITRS